MKQNKKLQNKIVNNYLIVILSMSIIVLVVFNLTMRIYINRTAQNEIAENRETVKVLLKDALKDIKDSETILPKAREFAKAVNQSFKLTQLTSESEIALINATGEVLLPRESDMSQLMRAVTTDISNKLSRGIQSGTFHITFDKKSYLASFDAYNDAAINNRSQYLAIVTSLNSATLLLRRTNIILVTVIIFTALLGTLMFKKLAKDITRPIGAISDYAKSIASGDFKTMSIDDDTHEIVALCHDLNAMSQSLRQADQVKVDFLQNFSHDLRTPLMSIQGYAEGIATGVFPEATKPAAIIASESLRLKHLVDQLITLSRLDMSNLSITGTPVHIHDFFSLLMSRYEGLATKDSKKIILNCPKELTLSSDEDLLEKLFGNLLSNAIRFANAYVVIDVSIDSRSTLVIKVQDDGPGIPESAIPHLFDRFYKGDNGNFGLGLAIANTSANLLGFKLQAENHTLGSIFTASKPLL